MKKFAKNIIIIHIIIFMILLSNIYLKYDDFKNRELPLQKLEDYTREYIFDKKNKYFEKFIENNNSINLILGSSLIEALIIPDSLGINWFSYSNPAQNIYNTYKFLNFYRDSVKFDTILIGIQPFDFPSANIKVFNNRLPFKNYNFIIYDSISLKSYLNQLKRKIQFYKSIFFRSLFEFSNLETQHVEKREVHSKQGFSGRLGSSNANLDSLYTIRQSSFRHAKSYFHKVENSPNMEYFDLFKDLTDSLNVEVIFLITPKSKYYHLDLAEYKHDSIWNNVLDSLEKRNVQIWDYEEMNTDTFNFDYFHDDTHSSYNGAKAFTKIIKKRLRD